MSTCIAFMTRHGAAEKVAIRLKEKLHDPADLVNLKKEKNPDINTYDTVIIGGSIHAGRVQGGIKKFCRKKRDELLQKRLGLYLCCMEEGDTARDQFYRAFPEELRGHACAIGLLGGEFNFKRMSRVERAIVRKITGISESVSRLDETAIAHFAQAFNSR